MLALPVPGGVSDFPIRGLTESAHLHGHLEEECGDLQDSVEVAAGHPLSVEVITTFDFGPVPVSTVKWTAKFTGTYPLREKRALRYSAYCMVSTRRQVGLRWLQLNGDFGSKRGLSTSSALRRGSKTNIREAEAVKCP